MVMNEEKNQKQREYRKKTGNKWTNKYEKTINGFLVRKYRNMQSRVTGVQKLKHHLYKGKDLLDRETFYQWSKSSDIFKKLFDAWTESGYSRKLCPSVDRINSLQGYHLSNMAWVTHSQNSSKTSRNKKKI